MNTNDGRSASEGGPAHEGRNEASVVERATDKMNKERPPATLESELANLEKKKRKRQIGDVDYAAERKRILAKYQKAPKKSSSKAAEVQLRKARWALLLKFLNSKGAQGGSITRLLVPLLPLWRVPLCP